MRASGSASTCSARPPTISSIGRVCASRFPTTRWWHFSSWPIWSSSPASRSMNTRAVARWPSPDRSSTSPQLLPQRKGPMHSLQFHDPQLLWLLALVPLVVALPLLRRRRATLLYPTAAVLAHGPRGRRVQLLRLLPFVQAIALMLGVVALARPQAPAAEHQQRKVEGIDLAVALDLSTSMEAGDLKPRSRLEVAKQVLTDFVGHRANDRI